MLLAAEKNLLGVVQHLRDKKVDVNTTDDYGRTPMHAAAKNGQSELGSKKALREVIKAPQYG